MNNCLYIRPEKQVPPHTHIRAHIYFYPRVQIVSLESPWAPRRAHTQSRSSSSRRRPQTSRDRRARGHGAPFIIREPYLLIGFNSDSLTPRYDLRRPRLYTCGKMGIYWWRAYRLHPEKHHPTCVSASETENLSELSPSEREEKRGHIVVFFFWPIRPKI